MKILFSLLFIFLTAFGCCDSKKLNSTAAHQANLPVCIKDLIKKHQSEEKKNPPIKIYSYLYNGKTVYYESAACCDMYSNLYSNDCSLLGHPDGGFTGRGDGKFPDFAKEATNQKLVWEDKRQ